MDALTLNIPAAAPNQNTSLRSQTSEPSQDQSFDQLMSAQRPDESAVKKTQTPEAVATEAQAQQPQANETDVSQGDAQPDPTPTRPREASAQELADDADPADAARVAAAAALLQWLTVAPAPVSPAQTTGFAGPLASSGLPTAAADTNDAQPNDAVLGGGALSAATILLPTTGADTQDKGADSGPAPLPGLNTNAGSIDSTQSFGALFNATSQPAQLSALSPQSTQVAGASLESPVGTHEWAEELGTRLAVMTARGEQTGSLRLSPEHLGPLEVQIRVQDDKASVVFGAQHADTRSALQEALPRLRELFAASGLQLLDAGVSRDGARQAMPSRLTRNFGSDLNADSAGLETSITVAGLRHSGTLDTIA